MTYRSLLGQVLDLREALFRPLLDKIEDHEAVTAPTLAAHPADPGK
jgi:hypothetical protein